MAKKNAPAKTDTEIKLSTFDVFHTLHHDGDRYVAGETIDLDPNAAGTAQLLQSKVIGVVATPAPPAGDQQPAP